MAIVILKALKLMRGFYSRGITEALPDLDDRVTVSGEKREAISGDERDIIL